MHRASVPVSRDITWGDYVMSYPRIRHALRIATVCAWVAAGFAAAACIASGVHATVGRILIVATLLAVITCTTLIVDVMIGLAEQLAERFTATQPSAEAVAARAILLGREITRDQYEAGAHLPRLSDYRGR